MSEESVEDLPLTVDGLPNSPEHRKQPQLFPGSLLTASTNSLLISSYISRHHLTRQAQEDLLHLLQLHSPASDSLPSSLYTFRKSLCLSNSTNVKCVCHYFCPRCNTYLPGYECGVCPMWHIFGG